MTGIPITIMSIIAIILIIIINKNITTMGISRGMISSIIIITVNIMIIIIVIINGTIIMTTRVNG